jgi:hypothetical protein
MEKILQIFFCSLFSGYYTWNSCQVATKVSKLNCYSQFLHLGHGQVQILKPYFYRVLLFVLLFWDSAPLCSLGWPQTLHLPAYPSWALDITGMCHHTWPTLSFFNSFIRNVVCIPYNSPI